MSKYCIVLIAFFILFSGQISAQDRTIELSISFEESITENLLSSRDLSDASWIIKDANTQLQLSQGEGQSLYNFIFEQPGNYQIDFTLASHEGHSDGCFHPDLPNKVLLKVSNHSITYLIDECELSKELRGGVDASGTILSIPVEIKSYNNEEVEIPINVFASGISANIVGNLHEEQRALPRGNYVLNYSLTGTALKDTYISFDFEDVNKNIYSFSYLNKIK